MEYQYDESYIILIRTDDYMKKRLFLILVLTVTIFAGDFEQLNVKPGESYIHISRTDIGTQKDGVPRDWNYDIDIDIKGKLKKEPKGKFDDSNNVVAVYTFEAPTVSWNVNDVSHEDMPAVVDNFDKKIIRPPCQRTVATIGSGTDELKNMDVLVGTVGGQIQNYHLQDKPVNERTGSYKSIGTFKLTVYKGTEFLAPDYTTFKTLYYYTIDTGLMLNPDYTYTSTCKNDAPKNEKENLEFYLLPLKNNFTLGVNTIEGSIKLPQNSLLEYQAKTQTDNIYSFGMAEEGYASYEVPPVNWNVQWKMVLPEELSDIKTEIGNGNIVDDSQDEREFSSNSTDDSKPDSNAGNTGCLPVVIMLAATGGYFLLRKRN